SEHHHGGELPPAGLSRQGELVEAEEPRGDDGRGEVVDRECRDPAPGTSDAARSGRRQAETFTGGFVHSPSLPSTRNMPETRRTRRRNAVNITCVRLLRAGTRSGVVHVH